MEARADIVSSRDEHDVLTAACEAAGLSPGTLQLTRLSGGANNQVFAAYDGGASVVVKRYFRHSADDRDRRAAEYAFATFADAVGADCIPRPLYSDTASGVSAFSMIDGRPVSPDDVDEHAVDAAMRFFERINSGLGTPAARALPAASEACFSLGAHIDRIDARVARLSGIEAADDIDRALAAFVEDSLATAWQKVAAETRRIAKDRELDLDADIPERERCVSPSDFGFHNALLDAGGKFWFFDFEYAGWDDPAKMTADFFCQKAVPVPLTFVQTVIDRAADTLSLGGNARYRMAMLLPVYQVKWCCILLNEFLPTGRSRRAFATGAEDMRPSQLEKARLALRDIDAYTDCRNKLLSA